MCFGAICNPLERFNKLRRPSQEAVIEFTSFTLSMLFEVAVVVEAIVDTLVDTLVDAFVDAFAIGPIVDVLVDRPVDILGRVDEPKVALVDVDVPGDAFVDILVEGPVTRLLDKPVVATLSTVAVCCICCKAFNKASIPYVDVRFCN